MKGEVGRVINTSTTQSTPRNPAVTRKTWLIEVYATSLEPESRNRPLIRSKIGSAGCASPPVSNNPIRSSAVRNPGRGPHKSWCSSWSATRRFDRDEFYVEDEALPGQRMIGIDESGFLFEFRNPDQDDFLPNLGLKPVPYLDFLW